MTEEEKKNELISRMGDYAADNYENVVKRMTRVEVLAGTLEVYVKMREEDRQTFGNDVDIQDGYIKMTFKLGPVKKKCKDCPYEELLST